jgi:hypothetical protein
VILISTSPYAYREFRISTGTSLQLSPQTVAGRNLGGLLPACLLSPATGRSSERVVTNRIIAGIVGSNETACSHTACVLGSHDCAMRK